MLIIHHISDNISYLCVWNVQYWARVTKSNMEIQRYNRLKAAIKREQNEVHFNTAEREQARTQFKIGLAEKERTGTWLSEQMGHNICTVSRWMTNKVEPTCGKFDLVARLSENSTRLHATSTWM